MVHVHARIVTHGSNLQLLSIPGAEWHTRCFVPSAGASRRRCHIGGSMKGETIILRSLYVMAALVVVFGICSFLIHGH
jgi:hypothetical protein